jgi:ferritin
LKEESLRKQLAAFESRRQAVRLLRDSFGTNDSALVEKAKLAFKEKEESFAKTMEESKEISKKANDLAKEASKKNRE